MSSNDKIHLEFPGRILFVGFGSIGQGVLPLILRHIGIAPERLTIVTAEDKGNEEAARYGVKFVKERLTRENYRRVLNPLLGRGDFLINTSTETLMRKSPRAQSAAGARGFPHQRLGRGVERRAHQAVLGKG